MNILRWLCLSACLLTGVGGLIFVTVLFLASGVALVFLLALPGISLALLAAYFAYRKKEIPGLIVSLLFWACPVLLMNQHLLLFEDAFWLLPAPALGLAYFGLGAGLPHKKE